MEAVTPEGPPVSRALLEAVVESAPVARVVTDARGTIRLANRAAHALFGLRGAELVGTPVDALVPKDRRAEHARHRDRYHERPHAGRMGEGREVAGVRRDGAEVPLEVALAPLDVGGERLVLAVLADVTERRRLERDLRDAHAELERRACERAAQVERVARERDALLADVRTLRAALERSCVEDALTGLLNRPAFLARLDAETRRAERMRTPLAVARLDLDRLKVVNERFGHALGETVLCESADLIRHHCRAIDVIARCGADEFALALPGTDLAAARGLCERIGVAFARHDWARLRPGLAVSIRAGAAAWRGDCAGAALFDEAAPPLSR